MSLLRVLDLANTHDYLLGRFANDEDPGYFRCLPWEGLFSVFEPKAAHTCEHALPGLFFETRGTGAVAFLRLFDALISPRCLRKFLEVSEKVYLGGTDFVPMSLCRLYNGLHHAPPSEYVRGKMCSREAMYIET